MALHTLLLMYATGAVALRPRAPRVQGQVILRQNRPILPPGIGAACLRRQGDAYINSNICATPSFFHFSATCDHLDGQSPCRICALSGLLLNHAPLGSYSGRPGRASTALRFEKRSRQRGLEMKSADRHKVGFRARSEKRESQGWARPAQAGQSEFADLPELAFGGCATLAFAVAKLRR